MMEKYGVSDKVDQMKQELEQVRKELHELRNLSEKTASTTGRVIDLQKREGQLIAAISSHS